MPSTLANFTLSAAAAPDDFIVGYDEAVLNGERRWTLSTIANAVSGIMQPALQNLVNEQTITLSAPTGTVVYYALSAAPSGWEECNGFTVTTALGPDYTSLRNFLTAGGYKFGSVGSDPKVPDLRGRFIRSFGTDSTVSPIVSSGVFGVKQEDAFKSHSHPYAAPSQTFAAEYQAGNFNKPQPASTASNTSAVGGTETRPANLALLACIKL